MRSNRYLVIIILLLSYSILPAQESGEIVLTTQPSGATVHLNGEYDLVANTPARLPIDIAGQYKAKITRPGCETWRGTLTFLPGGPNEIDIKLKTKTRFKSALRSMIIPGWGQMYYGNSLRGSMLTSAAILSAASIIVTDHIYGNKSRDYNSALADFNGAKSIEEKERLKIILNSRQKDAYDAETNRNIAIAIGIAGWAVNVVDALLFFPDNDVIYPTITSLGDGASITISARF